MMKTSAEFRLRTGLKTQGGVQGIMEAIKNLTGMDMFGFIMGIVGVFQDKVNNIWNSIKNFSDKFTQCFDEFKQAGNYEDEIKEATKHMEGASGILKTQTDKKKYCETVQQQLKFIYLHRVQKINVDLNENLGNFMKNTFGFKWQVSKEMIGFPLSNRMLCSKLLKKMIYAEAPRKWMKI